MERPKRQHRKRPTDRSNSSSQRGSSSGRSLRASIALVGHAGSPFMLCLRQFAFSHNALMLFVCTLDAIFELAPIVRELLGHYIGPARHIATDCRPDVHGLTNPEFMRGHRAPPSRAGPCAFALTLSGRAGPLFAR